MTDSTKQEQEKARILDLVDDYVNEYLISNNWQAGDRISYSGRVFGTQEVRNLVDASLDFWLTSGKWTDLFETKLAEYLNVDNVLFVNSGSSANLLAFMTLTSPLLKERAIQRGDEVITVAAGFPTTVAPIIQYGAIPVFVDVSIPEYNVEIDALEAALSEKTKAVMLAHTLGNPFDIKHVKEFCKQNNLWLIEDNCDALGSEYTLDGKTRFTGTFGDIATSSFYPPHHMTTGEGGAIYTSNPLLSKIALSMRDWGRDCICKSGQDNRCGNRFIGQFGELPFGYDHKYVYSHFGYNLKATDLQAAIGCAQIDRLPEFTDKRRHNHQKLSELLQDVSDRIILPKPTENSNPSWFGFAITAQGNEDRSRVVNALEKSGVQTRLLFAGNIIMHPAFDHLRNTDAYRVVGNLDNTNEVMNNTFWIGVYPGMNENMIQYMSDVIHEALE